VIQKRFSQIIEMLAYQGGIAQCPKVEEAEDVDKNLIWKMQ
jgi:hypothetical protein